MKIPLSLIDLSKYYMPPPSQVEKLKNPGYRRNLVAPCVRPISMCRVQKWLGYLLKPYMLQTIMKIAQRVSQKTTFILS